MPEYSTELLELLNVLGLLTDMEPAQADLLVRICAAPLLTVQELTASGALEKPPITESAKKAKSKRHALPSLFSDAVIS